MHPNPTFIAAAQGVANNTFDLRLLLVLTFPFIIAMVIYQNQSCRKTQASSSLASPFATPLPKPLEDFDLSAKRPEKYRPFRHGANHVTMGIRRLDWNEWIQMDSNFLWYHDLKARELKKDFPAHVQYVDNAVTRDACFEVQEELVKYLTHRFPRIFQLKGGVLRNTITKEEFPYPAKTPEEALATSALLVQDDLVIMVKNDDGSYHLDAAAVCLPGFWRLKEKFRTSLDELHIEAKVPHYRTRLMKSMNRFFETLSAEKPVTRNNFFIQLDDGLHWSHRMGEQKGDNVASWALANDKGLKIEDLHFRSERQTLRRLPRSKTLLFTIRTYFEPITTIAKEPHVPGRLAEAIRAWDETVSTYKGKSHWDHILLPYLDEQAELQRQKGILDDHPEAEFPY
ncbi:hypothetical protein BU24DRAFT_437236 [Aaosphaeria arxii CBS 175.79]|uniref:Uncharacterized protein n=1 Tax=Aaosphaeria arxii CBS 175.79 TaxID=1450172 RepID=A0A6A5X9Q8_9PLEO|nr:uncharacterized protein BU24DRAFT_437236 [Aaosphaeria arxii CBS 175.79]KAF2009650.1 hypothetical protein BU24DRAFT_437236 [Aaosphaeria arxii CBS 175.79]